MKATIRKKAPSGEEKIGGHPSFPVQSLVRDARRRFRDNPIDKNALAILHPFARELTDRGPQNRLGYTELPPTNQDN